VRLWEIDRQIFYFPVFLCNFKKCLMNINVMKSLILSAGKYGQVYLSYLREIGVEIVGFLDDTPELQGTSVKGLPVLGTISTLPVWKNRLGVDSVYCPLGNNFARVKFLKEALSLGYEVPNFISPKANIGPDNIIGEHGVYILPGTTIMPWCNLQNFVMMSVNSIVSHHTTLEEGTFLSFGVNFGAKITAHKYSYLGIGSTIMSGVTELGTNCLVGAGAVVINNVPDNAIVAGVPAKILRYH
jgi:sugar O-acyltransferase (sialic acid O-acetyltransferase NeuD family)